LTAFVLGLLSKESVASAAGVVTALFFFLGLVPAWKPGARWRSVRRVAVWCLPFWLLVLPYVVITFVNDRDDPTGVVRVMYTFGPRIGPNLWWFLARLAAPLEAGHGPAVSAAGHIGAALLLAAAVWLTLRGRNEERFLVAWTVIALTPLTLWRSDLLLGRFTYMACAPFAVLLALGGARAADVVARRLPRSVPRWAPAAGLILVSALILGTLTMGQDRERTREGEIYRLLVATLKNEYPALPQGSEIVLMDGVWRGPFHAIFLNSMADTLYGPGVVRIRNTDGSPAGVLPQQHEIIRLQYQGGALVSEAHAD
jgi:hypothetical protein